jgi:hypothetical protein
MPPSEVIMNLRGAPTPHYAGARHATLEQVAVQESGTHPLTVAACFYFTMSTPLTLCRDPRAAQIFTYDEFAYYFGVAISAAELTLPTRNPETVGVVVVEHEGGSVERLSLVDNPMNRALLATKREIGDAWKFSSFVWRFWALMELIGANRLGGFTQQVADAPEARHMHPAVIDVARRLTLTKQGHFRAHEFLRSLRASKFIDDSGTTSVRIMPQIVKT